MTDIMINPTRAQLDAMLAVSAYGEVRVLVCDTTGTVVLGNASRYLHNWMAKETGVEYFASGMIRSGEQDEDYDYGLDNYNLYSKLKLLQRSRVNMPVVGIVQPKGADVLA